MSHWIIGKSITFRHLGIKVVSPTSMPMWRYQRPFLVLRNTLQFVMERNNHVGTIMSSGSPNFPAGDIIIPLLMILIYNTLLVLLNELSISISERLELTGLKCCFWSVDMDTMPTPHVYCQVWHAGPTLNNVHNIDILWTLFKVGPAGQVRWANINQTYLPSMCVDIEVWALGVI